MVFNTNRHKRTALKIHKICFSQVYANYFFNMTKRTKNMWKTEKRRQTRYQKNKKNDAFFSSFVIVAIVNHKTQHPFGTIPSLSLLLLWRISQTTSLFIPALFFFHTFSPATFFRHKTHIIPFLSLNYFPFSFSFLPSSSHFLSDPQTPWNLWEAFT